MQVGWNIIKNFIDSRQLSIQWFALDRGYWLMASDGLLTFECTLDTNRQDEIDVFEASYKANGNKALPQQRQPFASKTLPNGKKLYARTTGFQAALTVGANVVTYTTNYAWAKVTGIEVINCEALDIVELKVFDTATGTYSTIPNYQLNQFGYTVNLPKDFYQRSSPFDADLYVGMIIKIEYNSVSAKTVGFNLIMSEVK